MRLTGYVFDARSSFNAVVDWLHDDIIGHRHAPGLMVGLSGTDSLVAFIACYEALKEAGKVDRLLGIHFAPSEDFLCDHPEAETHNWFKDQIVPWLRERCPGARIEVDTSIDWRLDGARWGKMLDMSILTVDDHDQRHMRPHDEKYWIVGTRNRTEHILFTFSRASLAASMQPLVHLWKSEILQVSYYLGLPKIAVEKSCEADCICGRERLPAKHVRELDTLLAIHERELPESAANYIPADLRLQLQVYAMDQIARCSYKARIPYEPYSSTARFVSVMECFNNGNINLHTFDHRLHLYVAWFYLLAMPFEEAIEKYSQRLRVLLDRAGVGHKFNAEVTESYFRKLQNAMALHPGADFDRLMEAAGDQLR